MTEIRRMIDETDCWRKLHKAANRHIEAAACAIRIKALRDAIAAIADESPPPR
jgi:hypothetical protein